MSEERTAEVKRLQGEMKAHSDKAKDLKAALVKRAEEFKKMGNKVSITYLPLFGLKRNSSLYKARLFRESICCMSTCANIFITAKFRRSSSRHPRRRGSRRSSR